MINAVYLGVLTANARHTLQQHCHGWRGIHRRKGWCNHWHQMLPRLMEATCRREIWKKNHDSKAPTFHPLGMVLRKWKVLEYSPYIFGLLVFFDWLGWNGHMTSSDSEGSAHPQMITLHGTNISHLGKRKIVFPATFEGDMLVPRRIQSCNITNHQKDSRKLTSLAAWLLSG